MKVWKTHLSEFFIEIYFKKDNGNCIFDDTISIPELSEVCYDFDVPDVIYTVTTDDDRFLDNVLTRVGQSLFTLFKKSDMERFALFQKSEKEQFALY